MTFQTTSTIFFYEHPDRTGSVIKGVSIGSGFEVLEVVGHEITAVETWVRTQEGWLLVWDGTWYGKLSGI